MWTKAAKPLGFSRVLCLCLCPPPPSVLHTPLLLSDSRLHLFVQSDLSIAKIERCALGKTKYTVAEAIQITGASCVGLLEAKLSAGFDCER